MVIQSAAVLTHAMKDGMEALVQGISGALKLRQMEKRLYVSTASKKV